MSRRPNPEALNRLNGRHVKRMPPNPDFAGGDIPPCPKHLAGQSRKKWNQLAPLLFGAGLLATTDAIALARYCQSYGVYLDALEQIDKTGGPVITNSKGDLVTNPWQRIAKGEEDTMRKIETEFGLTPAARARVHVPTKSAESESLQDFLANDPAAD